MTDEEEDDDLEKARRMVSFPISPPYLCPAGQGADCVLDAARDAVPSGLRSVDGVCTRGPETKKEKGGKGKP
jgi:hypothetical protein